MLIISQNGPLGLDRLDVLVTTPAGQRLFDSSYRIPEEATLPTTLSIVSNGNPTATALIRVSGWKGGAPLDVRDAIVRQIPVDRVAELRIVLSGRCVSRVEVVDGKAITTCGDGSGNETCDPATGECVSAAVDGGQLPPYQPGAEHEMPGGSSGAPGVGGADQGGNGGEGGAANGCRCGTGEACLDGTCIPRECTPNQRFCSSDSVRECDENGLSSVEIKTCDNNSYCDAASATCQAGLCAPSEPTCDGNRATVCDASGADYEPGGTECGSAETCDKGACVEQVCVPDQAFCQGDAVKRCSHNGLGSSIEETCSATEYCDNADALCRPQACTPKSAACAGSTVRVCRDDGSGFDDVANCPSDQHCDVTSASCVAGACPAGYGDCTAAPGCETQLGTIDACLGCGDTCKAVNGTNACTPSGCQPSCDPGYDDCNGNPNDGCETDTTTDPEHCGGCMNPCSIPNAKAACVNSSCALDQCLTGFDDCTSAAGCETNVSSSVQHCGGCDLTCSRAGATSSSCTNGMCDPPTCDASHLNCDGKNANGCEMDGTTPANCGACTNACGTATPNCVLSDTSYECQAQITIANALPYPSAQVIGSTLPFNATPHAGTNRLALVAIATDGATSGLSASRPASVMFGSQSMLAGPAQVGTNDLSSPDLFIYYLPLGDASSEEPQVTLTINGASGAPMIMVQSLQLNGVRQDQPIAGSAGNYVGTPDAPDPSVSTVTLPVETSGSLIYSFACAYWSDTSSCTANAPSSTCPTWSVTPSTNLTVTETLATAALTVSATPVRMFGMVVSAASARLPAAGSYQPSWSFPYTGRLTHLAVAIAPAQSP
jgi:hypothetical protein